MGGFAESMQAEFAEFTAPGGPRQLSAVPSSASQLLSLNGGPCAGLSPAFHLPGFSPAPPRLPIFAVARGHPRAGWGWVPVVEGTVVPAPTRVAAEGLVAVEKRMEGRKAVWAQAALFIIPRHLELGFSPPNSLERSDTFVFPGHCSQRPLSGSDGQPGQKPSALGWPTPTTRSLQRPASGPETAEDTHPEGSPGFVWTCPSV